MDTTTTIHYTAPGFTLAYLDPHQLEPGLRDINGGVCGTYVHLVMAGLTVEALAEAPGWIPVWQDPAAEPADLAMAITWHEAPEALMRGLAWAASA